MKNLLITSLIIFSSNFAAQAQSANCAGEIEYLNSTISLMNRTEQLYNDRIDEMKRQSSSVFLSGIANSPRGMTSLEAGTQGANASRQHENKIDQLVQERNLKLIDYETRIASIRRQSAQCFR
jgi:hypothetical protein